MSPAVRSNLSGLRFQSIWSLRKWTAASGLLPFSQDCFYFLGYHRSPFVHMGLTPDLLEHLFGIYGTILGQGDLFNRYIPYAFLNFKSLQTYALLNFK